LTTKELVLEFRKIRVVDISDACDANGLFYQVMDQTMRPLQEGLFTVGADEACMCGPALTMEIIPEMQNVAPCETWEDYHRAIDPPGALERYKEFLKSMKDHVVVSTTHGYPLGLWGSDNAMAGVNNGAIGYIQDGGVRDSAELKREGVKIWATSRTCLHLWPRMSNVGRGGSNPIMCAGVLVRPGDIICADDDGVVVVPIDKAEKILEFAKKTLLWDQKTRRQNYKDAGMPFDSTVGYENSY